MNVAYALQLDEARANDAVVVSAGGFKDEDTPSFVERLHRRLLYGSEDIEGEEWIDEDADEVANTDAKIIELASFADTVNRMSGGRG
ncbi:MAG: hypothetical protein KGR26_11365 [Cyanobacteria bacterium REEB65]|nr:hypothetical protein [Cyanobacteria bacterium REEB65]